MDQFFASQQIFKKARECAQKVNACFVDLVKQGCATHGPRATIRPSRPVNVALDDGRTKKFSFKIDLFSYLYHL